MANVSYVKEQVACRDRGSTGGNWLFAEYIVMKKNDTSAARQRFALGHPCIILTVWAGINYRVKAKHTLRYGTALRHVPSFFTPYYALLGTWGCLTLFFAVVYIF